MAVQMVTIINTIKIIANRLRLQTLTYNPHWTLTLYDSVDHSEKISHGRRLARTGGSG